MQEYKPNSYRFKELEKNNASENRGIQKVTKNDVKVQKKGVIESAIDAFVKEDIPNIKEHLLSDILIPTIKNTIWDTFTNVLDMILYNGSGHRINNEPGSSRIPYVSYNKYSNNQQTNNTNSIARRNNYNFSYITFKSKYDADDVLKQMDEIMDQYKLVRVADLYELIGKTPDFTDQKYGWQDIRSAKVVQSRGGYHIELPKPLPID